MPIETQSSNQYSRPAGDMGVSVEVKRSSRPHETSKVLKQRILSAQTNQSPKSKDKHNMETPVGQSNLDRHHETRGREGDGLRFQTKSSKNSEKPWTGRKASKNDELIKHMSNLPGYLQRVEKRENLQEKALNFGVLDWERLETWKDTKRTQPRGNTNASPSGGSSSFKVGGLLTHSNTVQSKSLALHKKQLNQTKGRGFSHDVNRSQGEVTEQDFKTASRNTLDGPRDPSRRNKSKSSGGDHSEKKFERGKREDSDQNITCEKETSWSGLRKHEFSHPSKNETSANHSVTTTRWEELQKCHGEHRRAARLLPKHKPKESCSASVLTSGPGTSFDAKPRDAYQESYSGGFSSEEVHSAELNSAILNSCPLPIGVKSRTESGMRPHSSTHAQSMGLSSNASCVFLCETPTVSSQGKCVNGNASSVKPSSENGIDASGRSDRQTTEPAAAKGRHPSHNRRFSFSLGRISRSLSFKESSDVPQLSSTCANVNSGPVRSEASDSISSGKVHSAEDVHSVEFYSETLHTCQVPVGKQTNTKSDFRRQRSSSTQNVELAFDDSRMFTCPNEAPNTPSRANAIKISKRVDQESPEAAKGRHPSPNRRFGFGLGRMSRSFSFKEGSTVPQLSSTYATIKSGPVRSEGSDSLDSASKYKASSHVRARSSPLRRLLNPLLKGRLTNPIHSAETIQSLTGNSNLTSKVVSSIESPQEKKNETSTTTQAFLQLTIKNGLPLFKLVANNNRDILVALKKPTASGKDDDADWSYTFFCVSEIKKSGSWMSQGHKGNSHGFGYNVIGQMKVCSSLCLDFTVRRSKDLFTVRESVLYSVDHGQADHESPELAVNRELAAIIVKIPIGNSVDDEGKELVGKGFDRTTVILPGGVHGLPNKGVPSPLIERWKSGGSCDCGGWDFGCKLRVFSNDDKTCKNPGLPLSCSYPDHFNLFNQGGASDDGAIFSLAPLEKGIYSVEFSASISLLQAFSICVAVMGSQKLFDSLVANVPPEAKLAQESTLNECERIKTPVGVRGGVPRKYVPPPPLSPVGRV